MEPERPVPEVLSVSVLLSVPDKLVALNSPVEELNVRLDPLFGGRSPVASVTNNGKQVASADSSATVTLVAVVAVVADVALPLNAAVIIPALKLPDASLATIVDAVFADVALLVTVNVDIPELL